MAHILIEGHTDHPLLPNEVLSAVPVVTGETNTTIGEAVLTFESMIPSPEKWKTNPQQKYDGMFKFGLNVTKREDLALVADFLWYEVYAQSDETEILRIGDVEVGEQSKTRYLQLLEELCSKELPS